MKLLLDENLPHALRLEIPGHDVRTVAFMGWKGVSNGTLLTKAATEGFDALITNDRAIEHEHDLSQLPIAVVLLNAKSNTLEAIRPILPAMLRALASLQPRTLAKVLA